MSKKFKGEKLLRILAALENGALDFAALLTATLITPKGQQHRIKSEAKLIRAKIERSAEIQKEANRISVLLHNLQKQGFIEQKGSLKILTANGLKKLLKLRQKNSEFYDYKDSGEDFVKIISYDVPEKLKNKRNWLREVLKNLNFKIIHKSVWIGKTKLPKRFIDDLQKLGLLKFVQIVGVSKSGTIEDIL